MPDTFEYKPRPFINMADTHYTPESTTEISGKYFVAGQNASIEKLFKLLHHSSTEFTMRPFEVINERDDHLITLEVQPGMDTWIKWELTFPRTTDCLFVTAKLVVVSTGEDEALGVDGDGVRLKFEEFVEAVDKELCITCKEYYNSESLPAPSVAESNDFPDNKELSNAVREMSITEEELFQIMGGIDA